MKKIGKGNGRKVEEIEMGKKRGEVKKIQWECEGKGKK